MSHPLALSNSEYFHYSQRTDRLIRADATKETTTLSRGCFIQSAIAMKGLVGVGVSHMLPSWSGFISRFYWAYFSIHSCIPSPQRLSKTPNFDLALTPPLADFGAGLLLLFLLTSELNHNGSLPITPVVRSRTSLFVERPCKGRF